MFFSISPVRQPKKQERSPNKTLEESEKTEVLSLAPFSTNPKLFFENVPVQKAASRKIVIRNPVNQDLELSIKSNFPEDLNVTFSWLKQEIKKDSDTPLELVWIPNSEGSWRYTFTVCGGCKIKRDIPVAFKSIRPKIKGRAAMSKKAPTFPVNKIKSPPKKYKKTPPKKLIPRIAVISPTNSFKENFNPDFDRRATYTPNYSHFASDLLHIDRRGTYTKFPHNEPLVLTEEVFDDSLEKNLKPLSLSVELDGMKFSPNTPMSRLSYPNFQSTEEKSRNSTGIFNFSATRLQLFPSPLSSHNAKINTETYVKTPANISTETYLKDKNDLSHNISTETYLKDLSGLEVKSIIEANLWSNSQNEPTRKRVNFDHERGLKRKSDTTFKITPPKRALISTSKLTDFSKSSKNFQNPHDFLDPFLTFSDEWMQEQEIRFKKWLNFLLTPPVELDTGAEITPNITEMWRKCKKTLPPTTLTKEEIAYKYSNSKLDQIRKTALALYRSKEIGEVLGKVSFSVEKQKLEIRADRDLHLDIGLQSQIMGVILSYNPLWLRIGLETIYNEIIPMNSNSDIMGLTTFLLERFFKDPVLIKKHKTIYTPKYTIDIKKFILKKFFALVYFLDQAKLKKIIAHDPCLFRKNSEIKESREIILKFSRETLQAVGDVTKYLKCLAYIVQHKQTYIEEFNFAVNCLGVDLRDGVRLTKLMEIILLEKDLLQNLRVPAISRLQKIHNMKTVFDCLQKYEFSLIGDIEPKDLVDGHREKTLSFLWQIVYKFQTPFMNENARKIQNWWRSFPIALKRQKLRRRHEAAAKIQRWYREKSQFSTNRTKAAVKIQSLVKMMIHRKRFLKLKRSVIVIQRFCRVVLENRRVKAAIKIQSYFRMYIARKQYKQLKNAVKIIENRYKSKQLMLEERDKFLELKAATIRIQQWYKSIMLMRLLKSRFQLTKYYALFIEDQYLALKAMRKDKRDFGRLKWAALVVQRRYRAKKLMEETMAHFIVMKAVTIKIQTNYRGRQVRKSFLELKQATIFVQRRFRQNIAFKRDVEAYQKLKNATILIQRRFRARLEARKVSNDYQNLKNASITIQKRFRANREMRKQLQVFCKLKEATLVVQRRFRAKLAMRKHLERYQNLRNASITIQRRFRANREMRKQAEAYGKLRKVTILVQRMFRSKLAMKKDFKHYQSLKNASTVIQRRFRANREMKHQFEAYRKLRSATILIQRKFRAKLAMRKDLERYESLRNACIIIQNRFRANREMRNQFEAYKMLRNTTIMVQRRFRAKLAMRKDSERYKALKNATIAIQRRFKANKVMKIEQETYQNLKKATVFVQQTFRAKKTFNQYQRLRNASLVIQRQFRAKKAMKIEVKAFEKLRNVTLFVQRKFRAKLAMRKDLERYQSLRNASIVIQTRFRAKIATRHQVESYQKLRNATVLIQMRFKAKLKMRKDLERYQSLRNASIVIQRRFRAKIEARNQFKAYQKLRNATIWIQSRFRAKLMMRQDVESFQRLKNAAIVIQRRFKASKETKIQFGAYKKLKAVTISVQRRFRAKLTMKKDLERYQSLKNAAIVIQRRFRANREMQNQFKAFRKLRNGTVLIQRKFRAKLAMRKDLERFQNLKNATIVIQRRFRANRAMKKDFEAYQRIRTAIIFLQQKFRATKAMWEAYNEYQNKKMAVLMIQRFYREKLVEKKAATVVQKYVRRFLVMKKFGPDYRRKWRILQIEIKAAVRIQALWRGYKTRSKALPKLAKIREKIIWANENACVRNTVKVRCQEGLDILRKENVTMKELTKALKDLEYGTRRCKETCLRLSKILSDRLYILISSSGRSLPDENLLIFATLILINFAKYEKSRANAFLPQYLEDILIVMLHWSDKDALVFPQLCTLFWIFAQNPSYKKRMLAIPNFSQMFVCKIRNCCIRKEKMAQKVVKGFSVFKYEPNSSKKLPWLEPDWGLDLKDKPRIFTHSVFAFDCLRNAMGL